MKARILKLAERIDAYSMRERAIIAGAIWVGVIMLGWLPFLMDPINLKITAAELELQKARLALTQLDKQKELITARQGKDPNRENRTRMKLLQSDVKDLNKSLAELTDNLIPPKEMAHALREILKADDRLHLVSVESIPAAPIVPKQTDDKAAKESTAPTTTLFRHGLRIEFDAEYLTGLEYLTRVEALPWAFYWENLQITATEYPKNRFVLIVNTISFDKEWIGV